MEAQPGDLLLFAADKKKLALETMGSLRCELARRLDLIDQSRFEFLWVVEFPAAGVERGGKPIYRHAPSLHHAHGGGSGIYRQRSRTGAGQSLRYRAERLDELGGAAPSVRSRQKRYSGENV